ATITDPTNPYVLGPQLLCAALELPLTRREADELGARPVLADLAGHGLVRRREDGSPDTARRYVTAATPPHDAVDVRGGIGARVALADGECGRLPGTADAGRAMATPHAGAVQLHQGATYVVDELDLDGGVAFV